MRDVDGKHCCFRGIVILNLSEYERSLRPYAVRLTTDFAEHTTFPVRHVPLVLGRSPALVWRPKGSTGR
jgi:hypothetical protein